MPGCAAQRSVGNFFNDHTQQSTHNYSQNHGQDGIQLEFDRRIEGHVSTYHDNVAMRKVQQQDDTVHHAVAQCDQGVDGSQLQTVDSLTQDVRQIHIIHVLSRFFSANIVCG